MPVISAFSTPNRKSGRPADPLTAALKVLDILEKQYAEDGGGTITDPFYYDDLIQRGESLLQGNLVSDIGDRLTVETKLGSWKIAKARESRKSDIASISKALDTDIEKTRADWVGLNASDPVQYLGNIAQSIGAVKEIGASMIDQLVAQNRIPEAQSLAEKLSKQSDEEAIAQEVDGLFDDNGNPIAGAEERLQNYAVVYTTNGSGEVVDMRIQRANGDTLAATNSTTTDAGVRLVGKNNQPITMRGLSVFVNKQSQDGFPVAKLGNYVAKIGTRSDILPDVGEDGAMVDQSQTARAHLDVDTIDPQMIQPARPSSAKPGTYAKMANGRIFRFNQDSAWDEIAPDAIGYFNDLDTSTYLRLNSLGEDAIKHQSGRLITKKDFQVQSDAAGMSKTYDEAPPVQPLGQQTTFGPQQSPSPQPQQQPGLQSVAPRTNQTPAPQQSGGFSKFYNDASAIFKGRPQ